MSVAWSRLQSGDERGAVREFNDILRKFPAFYPAETGLGFALLADREHEAAAKHFAAATARDERYLPAWIGRAEAELALGNDAATIISLERVVALDPGERTCGRVSICCSSATCSRSSKQGNAHDRLAGIRRRSPRFSKRSIGRPRAPAILRELAVTERDAGMLDLAEAHVRSALAIDDRDGETFALLSGILERQNRFEDAATAMGRAVVLDPRPEWRERRDALDNRAEAARDSGGGSGAGIGGDRHTGADGRDISASSSSRCCRGRRGVSRWSPPTCAITGPRPGSCTVTQTGVMDVFPNHTFQPSNAVRRGDLARIAAQLLQWLPKSRQAEVIRWRNARPRFADLPAGNLFYPAAAFAVSAGAMNVEGDRFFHTRPATGQEVAAAIARVAQLASR